ncbi:uncharacterized protein TNCV_1125081 [Trichonephila clavipes]|uniref:Uncharacterized protein n=1 Tax=Trichonephila clavipes TaxID=2585209 RepID=A0A8X6VAE5_TRICX|nr:uncharacterized protein TNCV_1125081 [Trichonephila clavipes]
MTAKVNAVVLDHHRITRDEIHQLLCISMGTTLTVKHQHLNFRKICDQSVSNHLTTQQRNTRIALSLSHLNGIIRRNTVFCHKLSLVTKHGVTILNPKASIRANSGNVRLHQLQRNQSPCTRVLVNS